MATYTEFFVWNDTDYADASDANGGGPLSAITATGGPHYVIAAGAGTGCDSDGAGTTLTDDSGNNWLGVLVDDWLCFDPTGTANLTRATSAGGGATITVSPAVALGASDKACNVGGAWALPQKAATVMTTSFVNSASSVPRCNIRNSTTAFAGAGEGEVDMANSGTLPIPLTFQGYTTTAGDGGMAEIDGDGLSNHSGTWDTNNQEHWVVKDLYIHGDQAGVEGIYALNGHHSRIERCKVKVTGAGSDAIYAANSSGMWIHGCWVTDASDDGIVGGYYGAVTHNFVESAGGNGIEIVSPSRVSVRHNIINGAGAYGIWIANDYMDVSYNYVYNTTDSGIYFDDLDGEYQGACEGNILDNCGSTSSHWGIEAEDADKYLKMVTNNAFWNCGGDGGGSSQQTRNVLEALYSVTLSASPAMDALNGDFRLNDIAGAGLSCQNSGFPSDASQAIWSG